MLRQQNLSRFRTRRGPNFQETGMSSPPEASTSSSGPAFPATPQQKTGLRSALEYTGIPPSWLEKRPKLPSRNWLIFIGVTSTAAGYYLYDRRECRRIKEEYCDRVKSLSEEPLHSMGYLRKVTVYGAKWPGDEDWDRSTKYFRKYVKVRPLFLVSRNRWDNLILFGLCLSPFSSLLLSTMK